MSLARARATIAALERSGVRDLIVCPGSRSAPLVVAATESSLRLTPVIDERSAAFFAIGQARATGRASAILCTSGTAGAHFYPAIIEASHAAVPLVVITADRPAELRATGASQTIDQRRLYGDFVRAEVDLGTDGSERALASAVARAVSLAAGPHPGPVHINAPARQPLLADAVGVASAPPKPSNDSLAPPAPRLVPDAAALALARARLDAAERIVIVAGPIAAADRAATLAVAELADSRAALLFAEATSQLRFGPLPARAALVSDFDSLLREGGFEIDPPDAIIEIGAPPTSAGYARALAAGPGIWRLALRPHLALDPSQDADQIIVGDLASSAAALTAAVSAKPGEFRRRWRDRSAETTAARAAATPDSMSGQAAVRSIVSALPDGAHLAVGNSLPIRWLDQACPGDERSISVHCQRGVAGIDGLIAGAVGTADASHSPTCLLLGDVSAAHDIGSLALAATVRSPLAICVLDNRGGQIFAELPYASQLPPATLERFFTTEPRLDFAAAAASFEVAAVTVSDPDALAVAVDAALRESAATLIRVILPTRSPEVLA